MNWETCQPEDIVRAVRLALQDGMHLQARQLAMQGAMQYPDHLEIRKLSTLLAPPRILPNHEPADLSVRQNHEWLKMNSPMYQGQWVALKAGELLAHAEIFEELLATVGDVRGKRILITRV